MPETHHCVARGCRRLACYGFFSVPGGPITWACLEDRGLIWVDDVKAKAVPPLPDNKPQAQGRLI